MARRRRNSQKWPDGIIVEADGTPGMVDGYDPESDIGDGPYSIWDPINKGSFEAHESEITPITGKQFVRLLRASDAEYSRRTGRPIGSTDDWYWAESLEKSTKPHYGLKVHPDIAAGGSTRRKAPRAVRGPVRRMSTAQLCAIGDKACRAELKRRGRDSTGKKRR